MGTILATHLSDFATLPTSPNSAVIAVTVTAGSLDLATVGNQVYSDVSLSTSTVGLTGHYVTFQADGGSVYITAGPTQASVIGANAPSPTATGTNTAGNCMLIASGGMFFAIPRMGVEQWIGFVTATSTATLRIFLSSY